MTDRQPLHYQPSFPPGYRPGIGLIGCGNIVKSAHLPAYQKHGLNVVGAFDPYPPATEGLRETYGVQRIYDSLDDLLADPAIDIVDVATFPDQRIPIMRRALAAGKHILAQKPLALEVQSAREMVVEAERLGLKVAVNQNGRWAPPWRIATLLIKDGTIGDVTSITHLFDTHFGWITGTRFDTIPHWLLYDYSIHWFDITQRWFAGRDLGTVSAIELRQPDQPAESRSAWGMHTLITNPDGTHAVLRSVGNSRSQQGGHYFWVHGTLGTLRGCVIPERFIELDTGDSVERFDFEGQWFPDGFAGTMGELCWAIVEDRQPEHSARNHLRTLALTLAGCRSAERNGQPVNVSEVTQ